MSTAAASTVIAALIFVFLLVLWFQGFGKLDQDGNGIAGAFAAIVAFILGALVFWMQWRARGHGQPAILALFFLFMCIVGSFQVGLAVQALANGFIRPTEAPG